MIILISWKDLPLHSFNHEREGEDIMHFFQLFYYFSSFVLTDYLLDLKLKQKQT